MPNELDPIVGQWYLHRDKGEMFRVVAVDTPTAYIEIQSFDGDVEELEAMSPQDWRQPLEPVQSAEDPWQDTRPPDESQ